MGRQFVVSAAILLSIFATHAALGQGQRKAARMHRDGINRHNHNFRSGPARALHLTPEERQIFRKNAERWLQLDPQQRNALRERDRVLRQRMKAEAETVLRDSGLRLDNGAREKFEQRYLQERRRIEHALRQEIEAKRQQELPQLKERLKSEFQSHQPSPSATRKQGK